MVDIDIYNFDKTSFIIGVICPGIVVTHTNQHGQSKAIQPSNQEQTIAICKGSTPLWVLSKPGHFPTKVFPISLSKGLTQVADGKRTHYGGSEAFPIKAFPIAEARGSLRQLMERGTYYQDKLVALPHTDCIQGPKELRVRLSPYSIQ